MTDVETIRISKEAKKLLKKIEKTGIYREDPLTSTAEFRELEGFKMLKLIRSKEFPVLYGIEGMPTANTYITVPEVTQYWIYQKELRKQARTSAARYWITTLIAVAALIKSFLPEILVGLESILKLLRQQ